MSSSYSHFMGVTLGGKYVVKQLLGHGGMGAVFLGMQRFGSTERSVAIKLLTRDPNLDPAALRRFHREIEVVGLLSHPNSVRVYDFGQTEDGLPYMVMEYLEGRSLKDVIQDDAPIPLNRTVHIVAQICDALAEAHEKGIVHRDLKPANIYLLDQVGNRDFVKVLDFGLAKDLRMLAESSVTIQGSIAGSPPYLSPEQVDGTSIDLRSDIYSLGCVLFEMVTGTRPYLAKDPVGLFMQHMDAPIPSARERAPGLDLPRALDDLLTRALAKKPAGRQSSILDLKRQLQDCLPDNRETTAPAMAAVLLPTEKTVTAYQRLEVTGSALITDEPTRKISVEQLLPTAPADAEQRETPFDAPPLAAGEATRPEIRAVSTEGDVEVEVESAFSPVRTRTESITHPRYKSRGSRPSRSQWLAGAATAAATLLIGTIALVLWRDDPTTTSAMSRPALAPAETQPAVRPTSTDAAGVAMPPPVRDAGATAHADVARPQDAGTRGLHRLVKLAIDSQPRGASVDLDGVRICRTPCRTEVAPRTSAQVLLQQGGFRDLRREVALSADSVDLGVLKLSPIKQRTTGTDRKKTDKGHTTKATGEELMSIE